jgi:hypothetical protein
MGTGLGLSGFLGHGADEARKFLSNWKKDGSILVWLYARGDMAWPSFNHPFITYGSYKNDKDEEVPCLRYPRFVSPDPEAVHKNQYFRNDDDTLQVAPALDPFLRLREWLRLDCDYPEDTVIFRWENPNPKQNANPIIEWRRGNLAKLVKKTQSTFAHTLDTKLDYFFVVAAHEAIGDGLQIVRCTKLLGNKMQEEIKEQMESNGEQGNPLLHPYCFKWVFDKNAAPMDSYKAFRYNQAELTEPIREVITAPDFPDPSADCVPKSGDKAAIRAAMEAAAVVALPWDHIFVPEWDDGAVPAPQAPEPSGGTTLGSVASEPAQPASAPPTGQPRTRRRKKVEAPKPAVEMIPCDDCQTPMEATATDCPKCGAKYEVDDVPEAAAPAPSQPQENRVSNEAPETKEETCFSCGAAIAEGRCTGCGLEVDDDIPF